MRKNIKTIFAVVGIMLLAVGVIAPQPAHSKAILEFFFPMLKDEGPDPSKTLTAPFAEPNEKNISMQGLGLPENSVPLDQPHKPSNQIGDWVTMAVSEAMTFGDSDYKTTLEKISNHFTPEGKAQFMAFLEENSLIRVLESQKFNVSGFVQEAPLLLNEGGVDGSYRWLYQVPVMISYIDRNSKGYKDKLEPVNQLMSLTIQVGRTTDRTPGHDLAIERWSGKVQSIKK
jgi:hypothetical protein